MDDLDQTMGIFRLGEEKADAKKGMPEFGMEDLGRTSSMSRVLEGFLDSEEEKPERTAPSGRKPAEEDPDATRALPRLNEDGRRPVSYTHLDVYKRQVKLRSGAANRMIRAASSGVTSAYSISSSGSSICKRQASITEKSSASMV